MDWCGLESSEPGSFLALRKGREGSFLPEVKFLSWRQTGPRLLTTCGGQGGRDSTLGLPVNSPSQQETSQRA